MIAVLQPRTDALSAWVSGFSQKPNKEAGPLEASEKQQLDKAVALLGRWVEAGKAGQGILIGKAVY